MAQPQQEGTAQSWFQTTHWSVVLSARGEGRSAEESLEKLCSNYWYPLYAYVRRQGFNPFEAEDLTQGFFEHFLRKDRFALADSSKGRFRTFLLAALRNFLNDARDHANRAKRGGGHVIISWDAQEAENRYLTEPAHDVTPELLYDRRWAATTVNRARQRVRAEFQEGGKGSLHDLLSDPVDGRELSYEEIAGRLDTTESAVKSTAHRLRQRFRQVLWEEVAQTVASPQDMDAELRALASLAAQEGL